VDDADFVVFSSRWSYSARISTIFPDLALLVSKFCQVFVKSGLIGSQDRRILRVCDLKKSSAISVSLDCLSSACLIISLLPPARYGFSLVNTPHFHTAPLLSRGLRITKPAASHTNNIILFFVHDKYTCLFISAFGANLTQGKEWWEI
jgi:hypothetical protein